jgi:hypothetical protein
LNLAGAGLLRWRDGASGASVVAAGLRGGILGLCIDSHIGAELLDEIELFVGHIKCRDVQAHRLCILNGYVT